METPVISIIVPTYNRERYIAQAISSAQKQSFKDWELIVVDDASTDKTEDVVMKIAEKDSRIRYVRQKENVGIAKNRNTGLSEAKGAYVAMLDSDDAWTDPDKLKKQLAFLKSRPDHAMVGTWVTKMDVNGTEYGHVKYEINDVDIRKKILFRNQFAQSSLIYRASVIKELGSYDPTYTVNDDYDLWLRVGTSHKFANIPEYTTSYRVHPGGITTEKRLLAADEHILIIRKYKKKYPCYALALLKGYARILLAFTGL